MKTAALAKVVLLSLLALLMSVAPATASEPPVVALDSVGTSIPYQGRLMDNGVAANGIYDFGFGLFDVQSGGTPIATCQREDVSVTDGLFSTALDFGDVFNGTAYWLGVTVRPGASGGSYTPLMPRSPMLPAPYAVSAHTMKTDLATSYFIPAVEGVLHEASSSGRIDNYGNGGIRLVSTDSGTQDIVFPISIPGSLYGQSVVVDGIYLDYKSSSDTADITNITVYRTDWMGNYEELLSLSTGWNRTYWDEITIRPQTMTWTLTPGHGMMAVRVRCTAADGTYISFTGLEVRLLHR